jgi:hypothetical protein
MTKGLHEELEASRRVLAQACPLIGEAHALCYALVIALASTPREEFTRDEIDALCQLSHELLNKLSNALGCFAELGENPDP